jgi:endonuclease/exonuclease/phosphatase (EEP) superfamily protein YafD
MINKDLTATSVTSFTVAGSDHRGLLATLALTAL